MQLEATHHSFRAQRTFRRLILVPTVFHLHRVPIGFEFPISRRQLRQLVRQSPADYRLVETKGISMPEGQSKAMRSISDKHHAGVLQAERSPAGWSLELRICALRIANLRPSLAAVSACLLADIESWTSEKLAQPDTAPAQRVELFLGFRPGDEQCESASFEVVAR